MQIFRLYPDARVLHRGNEIPILELYIHSYGAMKCELDSIPYQIEEDLPVAFLISLNILWYDLVHQDVKRQALLSRLELHDACYLLDSSPDIKELLEDLELVVLDAAHVQCILNHILKVQARVEYDV
jgi:hypothetical protein